MANFRFNDATARKVYSSFKNLLKSQPKSWNGKAWMEYVCNGREQGFCIKLSNGNKKRTISFCNFKDADFIVVYFDDLLFESEYGNKPTKLAWDNRSQFAPVEEKQAAEKIIDLCKEFFS